MTKQAEFYQFRKDLEATRETQTCSEFANHANNNYANIPTTTQTRSQKKLNEFKLFTQSMFEVISQQPNKVFTLTELGLAANKHKSFIQKVLYNENTAKYRTIYKQSGITNTHKLSHTQGGRFIPLAKYDEYVKEQKQLAKLARTKATVEEKMYDLVYSFLANIPSGSTFVRTDLMHITNREVYQRNVLKIFEHKEFLTVIRSTGRSGYLYTRTNVPMNNTKVD
jgi:hypothetical protein